MTAEQHVEKANATVYADRDSRKVVIVYAPTGTERLEFMSFGLN